MWFVLNPKLSYSGENFKTACRKFATRFLFTNKAISVGIHMILLIIIPDIFYHIIGMIFVCTSVHPVVRKKLS